MERTGTRPGETSIGTNAPSAPRNVRLLASGTPNHRTYLFLSVLAVASIILYGWIWIAHSPPGILPVDIVFSLVIAYFLGLWLVRWTSLRHMAHPLPVEAEPGRRVGMATSFVPDLEPLAMLEETLRHVIAIDYPHETWVLDEGDSDEVRGLCARLGVSHFTRRHEPGLRTAGGRYAEGTKHGNYNAWLDQIGFARYDIVALLDPDHVPESRYLVETIGHFSHPDIGYVQAPQVYYNQDASFIARGAAEETYRYYSSGLLAAYGLGHTIIVGSHCVHRSEALRAVGGLPAHDAEDLYLMREYQTAGWRGVFVPRILSMGLAPADWLAYLGQQRRWTRAILDLKLRAPRDPAARATLKSRVLNLLHGANYLRPLSLLLLYPLLFFVLITNTIPVVLSPRPLIAGLSLALCLILIGRFDDRFLLDPARESGWRWRALVLQVAKAPHMMAALFDVLLNRRIGYVTTPKSGGGRGPGALALPHIGVAVLSLLALVVALVRWGNGLAPVLVGVGAVLVVIPLILAWTAAWSYPSAFEPGRFDGRRQRMDGVFGSPAVAAPPRA